MPSRKTFPSKTCSKLVCKRSAADVCFFNSKTTFYSTPVSDIQDLEYTYDYPDYHTTKIDDAEYYSYEEEFLKNFKKYSHQDIRFNNSDYLLHYHHGDRSSLGNHHVIDTNLLVICSLVAILVVMVTIVIVIFRRQNKAIHREHVLIHQCLPMHFSESEENVEPRKYGQQRCITRVYQL